MLIVALLQKKKIEQKICWVLLCLENFARTTTRSTICRQSIGLMSSHQHCTGINA
jgi:ribosomal protein L40E